MDHQNNPEWKKNQCVRNTCKHYLKYFPSTSHVCSDKRAPREYAKDNDGNEINCIRCEKINELVPELFVVTGKAIGKLKIKKEKKGLKVLCQWTATKYIKCSFSRPYTPGQTVFEFDENHQSFKDRIKELKAKYQSNNNDNNA